MVFFPSQYSFTVFLGLFGVIFGDDETFFFRFVSIVIGDVGDMIETDEFDDDGSIWSDIWLISLVLWLFSFIDSVKSGSDECWSRFIWDERLLW